MTDTTPPALEPRRCSLGRAWVLPYLDLVDERPEVLASGLPFFLASEWDAMASMSPAERQRAWDRRARAALEERDARLADPKRTIHRGTKPPAETGPAF